MIPEIKFPEREVLISHVISSLDEYWEKNSQHVYSLPVCNHQKNLKITLPLKMISVNLPKWANSCGIENQLLVPQECVDQHENSAEWWKVDWWLAIFLMLEGWHERVWESIHGSIHCSPICSICSSCATGRKVKMLAIEAADDRVLTARTGEDLGHLQIVSAGRQSFQTAWKSFQTVLFVERVFILGNRFPSIPVRTVACTS